MSREYTYRISFDISTIGKDEKESIVDLYNQLENLDAGDIIRHYATLLRITNNAQDERQKEEDHAWKKISLGYFYFIIVILCRAFSVDKNYFALDYY